MIRLHAFLMLKLVVLAAAATLIACAPKVRFADQPVVWHVQDRQDTDEPQENKFVRRQYWLDVYGMRRMNRALEFHGKTPAHNTNALDEVPNSTWFTNRIGVRELTDHETKHGPVVSGRPELPLTVTRAKGGGTRPGFFAEDARGRRFLIKFDFKKNPGMQTGTGVIASRIFWAIGFNVPSETLFYARREQIEVGAGVTMSNEFHKQVPVTPEFIDAMFETSPVEPSGAYRLFASELLDGKPVGGSPNEGVRKDDANDQVPHEHRRELRGLRVFSAWLGHTDIKEDNTLDVYVEEGGTRFLKHYLVDLNECFGSHQANMGRLEDGWEHNVDWGMQTRALFALGLWKRPWEDQKQTPWPQIGAFSADHFDPERWRPAFPYWPFYETDAADAFWAAKIIMRFDRATLAAMVDEGEFPEPASAYLVDTLIERARRIGMTYIDSLTPLDAFHVVDGKLCAYDLAVHYGLVTHGVVERLERRRSERMLSRYTVDPQGLVCFPLPMRERYSVARLRMRRGDETRPAMEVHYKGGANPRVLGIIRVVGHAPKLRRP